MQVNQGYKHRRSVSHNLPMQRNILGRLDVSGHRQKLDDFDELVKKID